jgi:hypothetical protein
MRNTRYNEALERIKNAARDLQAACATLQDHFRPDGDAHPPMPQLISLEAAMLELKAARADFDAAYNFGSTAQESRAGRHFLPD